MQVPEKSREGAGPLGLQLWLEATNMSSSAEAVCPLCSPPTWVPLNGKLPSTGLPLAPLFSTSWLGLCVGIAFQFLVEAERTLWTIANSP